VLEDRLAPATLAWTGAVSNLWSANQGGNTNWIDQATNTPAVPAAGDTLVFPQTANFKSNVNDLAAGTSFAAISFTGNGYVLTGNGLQLTGGVSMAPAVSGDDTVSLPVALTATQTYTVGNANATLTLSDATNLGANTLTVTGAGDTLVTGTLVNTGGESGNLVKSGAGLLTLSGGNTYIGTTAISGGRVLAANTLALGGTTNGTVVANGADLELSGGITIAEPLTLTGFGVNNNGALFNSSGDNSVTGPVILTGAETGVGAAANTTLTLNTAIGGNVGLTEVGAGIVQLAGNVANVYTGLTKVESGTLQLNKSPGSNAVTGDLNLIGGQAVLLANDQIADNGTVIVSAAAGVGFNLNGHSETVGSLAGSGTATLAAGTLTVGGQGVSGLFSGTIAGPNGQLTKTGAGTFTLTGTGTYTGPTAVNGGTLIIDGTLSAASAVVVQAGGTLSGTGSVGPVSGTAGTVRPGDSGPGTLNTHDVNLGAASFAVTLAGTSSFSQLNVTGTVALNGTTLDATLGTGFTPVVGNSFTVINNDGTDPVTGTFAGLAEGATVTVGGHAFTVSYKGGDGNDVVLTATNQQAVTVTLTSDPNPSRKGQAVTLAAAVAPAGGTGTPTGTVTFFNGSTQIGTATLDASGVATFTTSDLPAGTDSLTATYSGDSTFAGGTSAVVTQTVTGTSAGTSPHRFATGAGLGGGPEVKVFDSDTGALVQDFYAFDPRFLGGVTVAVGDVNGDGTPDVIAGAGLGGGPEVKVFSGTDGSVLMDFMAYDPAFAGGVFVAAGDVDGDGKAEVITGAGIGGGPHVRVWSASGAELLGFMAYDVQVPFGVRVAAGDVNGDGKAEVITGAGPGGGPHVKVFNGTTGAVEQSYMAFDPAFNGGVWVAAGRLVSTTADDVLVGAGLGGSPQAKVFNGADGTLLQATFAFDQRFGGGVRVATAATTGGQDQVILGAGLGGGPHLRRLAGLNGAEIGGLYAYDPAFLGGVQVG
jgi:autotransporter-associated beta strand protein